MQSPSPSPSDAIQAQGVPGGWSHHTLGHPATSSETKGSSWVAAGHSSEQVTGPQATAAGRERHACKLTPCRTTPGVSLRADGAGATSRRGPGLVSSPRVPFLALSLGSPGAGVAVLPPHTAWSWPCSARCPLAGRLEMGSGRVGTEPTAPQPALPPPPPRGSASDFRFCAERWDLVPPLTDSPGGFVCRPAAFQGLEEGKAWGVGLDCAPPFALDLSHRCRPLWGFDRWVLFSYAQSCVQS